MGTYLVALTGYPLPILVEAKDAHNAWANACCDSHPLENFISSSEQLLSRGFTKMYKTESVGVWKIF